MPAADAHEGQVLTESCETVTIPTQSTLSSHRILLGCVASGPALLSTRVSGHGDARIRHQTTMASSTALACVGQTLPAPYSHSRSFRGLAERFVGAAISRLAFVGYKAFLAQVVRAYADVASARESAEVTEAMLRKYATRQWLVNLQYIARSKPQTGEIAGAPDGYHSRLELLRECAVSFNLWEPPRPGAMPYALIFLFEKSGTPNFYHAFEDSRIAASIRNGYYAHWALALQLLALFLANAGELPSSVVEPITEALDQSLRKALGLALGLPGNDELRGSAESYDDDIEILDIDEEQAAWSKYLRSTVQL